MLSRLLVAELKRDGTTIHSDVEISYVDAILGVTIPVRTVDGSVRSKSVSCLSAAGGALCRRRCSHSASSRCRHQASSHADCNNVCGAA